MKAARDGMNIFVRGTLPTNKRAMQSPPAKKLEKIARKVGKQGTEVQVHQGRNGIKPHGFL
jgi:hypothetical protein